MRLFLLTALTMVAFAANSILNRLALAEGHIGAVPFGAIRLVAGAVMLAVLCLVLRGRLHLGGPGRASGVLALLVYMFGFSLAYSALDAGLGALILFGMVQITMFAAAVMTRESIPALRWLGAGLASTGLAWMMWPGSAIDVSLGHAGLMALAGVGWGVYSLVGRTSQDALQGTAANFIFAAPFGVLAYMFMPSAQPPVAMTGTGIGLAIVAGALTSGLGYALWYAVLPKLTASVAAVAQLTVPVIALCGGVLFLSEVVTVQILTASALVLGGVALSVLAKKT